MDIMEMFQFVHVLDLLAPRGPQDAEQIARAEKHLARIGDYTPLIEADARFLCPVCEAQFSVMDLPKRPSEFPPELIASLRAARQGGR